MKRILLLSLILFPFQAFAQEAASLRQRSLSRWGVRAANYSGITPLGGGRYAVVSDKEPLDGFYVFRIEQDTLTGRVLRVADEGFRGVPPAETDERGNSLRDCEGVAFDPVSRTVYICGEGDQQILGYTLGGQYADRRLRVPSCFDRDSVRANMGFEALTYSAADGLFWTTTEVPLPADGPCTCPQHPDARNVLRLQAFTGEGRPARQLRYLMDAPALPRNGRHYCMGVPALCALADGRLVVLERELRVPRRYIGARTSVRLYLIDPAAAPGADGFVVKHPLLSFTTRLGVLRQAYASYEGICPGIRLRDGRQTLLLVSDSQARAGRGPIRLRDFVKVVVVP
ncbi:MAG: esterase-like activity of phytase family protein [Alloprevotella sp.]|nr:esterase-like activity of phytase family protein [Alloprevotella sp.]